MREDICIVIVNWNGWQHTIECLESLLRIETDRLHVIVADSASTDNSIERIEDWAAGKITAPMNGPPWHLLPQQRYLWPVLADPAGAVLTDHAADKAMYLHILALVRNGGFAAGCNAGIRHGLETLKCRFVWLLNNDAVVEPKALAAFSLHFSRSPRLGLCGGSLYEYYRPDHIQALGGGFDQATTRVWHIGGGRQLHNMPTSTEVRAEFYHPIGANMVVSSDFVREVGLMNENYFLYFEELDWAERGRSRFAIDFCLDAVVFHKEGAAIGSASSGRKSILSTYFLAFSKLLFLERFHPDRKSKAYRRFVREMLKHIWSLEFELAAKIICAIRDFRRGRSANLQPGRRKKW